jgi:hypothetical protein
MDHRDVASAAVEAFMNYTRTFRALDARAVAVHFEAPAIMISPHGVVALPDAAAVERFYTGVMADLKTKNYARTEFSRLAGRRLSDDLVVVSGSGAWVTGAGTPFSRFGMTYTLRLSDRTWRIVAAIVHDPDIS